MNPEHTDPLPKGARIVFMGTPEFAVPGLEALLEVGYPVAAVVTQPDRRKGRGKKVAISPVKSAALSAGLEVLQPERVSDGAFLQRVRDLQPDLLVVIAFGQLLKKDLLSLPRWGAVNVHASLLPRYRGAAPMQWAILNAEKETGLTAMLMDEGLDSGPMLLRRVAAIEPEDTFGSLHDRMARLSGPFLVETLQKLEAGELGPVQQDESLVTYAPKITKAQAAVCWGETAVRISALIRAMDPSPGAFTTFQGSRLKLFSPRAADNGLGSSVPGRVAGYADGRLLIETGEGILGVGAIQAPGKRRLPAADFLRGFPIPPGSILGSEG